MLVVILLLLSFSTLPIQALVQSNGDYYHFGGKELRGVGAPTLADSVTTKAYVDASTPQVSSYGIQYLTSDMTCDGVVATVEEEFYCYIWGRSSESYPMGSVKDENLFNVIWNGPGGESSVGVVRFDETTFLFNVTIPATHIVGSGSIVVKYFNKPISGGPYTYSLSEGPVDPTQSSISCQTVAESCPIPENGGFACTLLTKDQYGNPSSLGVTHAEARMNETEFGQLTSSFVESSQGAWTTSLPGYVMGYQMEVQAVVEVGATSAMVNTKVDREVSAPSPNAWTALDTKPGAPAASYHNGIGCYGAWCYVFGGYSPITNKVDRYDMVCDAWQTISDFSPSGISDGVRVSVAKNGRMHVMGRINGGDCPASIDVFDPKQERFVETYAFPLHSSTIGFGGHDCNDDYCYFVSGFSCANGFPISNGNINYFWRFDRNTEGWDAMPVNTSRAAHACSALAMNNGLVFMHGSYEGVISYSDLFEIYNVSTNVWVNGPRGGGVVRYGKMVEINGEACTIGGTLTPGTDGNQKIQCWKPSTGLWRDLGLDSIFGVYAPVVHTVSPREGGTIVFVFGGYDKQLSTCNGKSWMIHVP